MPASSPPTNLPDATPLQGSGRVVPRAVPHAANPLAALGPLQASFLIAACYYGLGKLGLLLAISPGFATPVWPPAGIAMAGVLLLGNRVWPGVWLGSFLVNLDVSLGLAGSAVTLQYLGVSAAIATGATIQAAVGAWLVRRLVGYPCALDRAAEISRFLFLGGPGSCVIGASVGVSTLFLAGLISPASYPFSWFTWWGGDTIGVVIFATLTMVLAGEPRDRWRRRVLTVGMPLCVAFALVVAAFGFAAAWERERHQRDVERDAGAEARQIQKDLDAVLGTLQSLGSLFASTGAVERSEFRTFVSPILKRYPWIRALEWAPRTALEDKDRLVASAREQGYPDFEIRELSPQGNTVPAASRREYFPIYYLEPQLGNEAAIGFDVASEPARRRVLERARDTGQPAVMGRVRLFRDESDEIGMILTVPIYTGWRIPPDLAGRRRELRGYVLGVLRIRQLVDSARADLPASGLALTIHDQPARPYRAPLYQSHPELATRQRSMAVVSIEAHMAHHPLHLTFWPIEADLRARRTWASGGVLAAGVLFTGLLGTFLLMVTGRTALVEQLAEGLESSERRFRGVVESVPNALVMVDGDGIIKLVNTETERMFGYTRHELLGHPVELLVPTRFRAEHPRHRDQYSQRPRARPMAAGRDLQGLRKDGTEFPVEVGLNPIETEDGALVLSSIVDISIRKSAEKALRDSEARFRALLDYSPTAVSLKTADGRYLLVNKTFRRLAGIGSLDVAGRRSPEIFTAEFAQSGMDHDAEIVHTRRSSVKEEILVTDDGKYTLLTVKFPILNAAGAVAAIGNISTDITERKQAEERERIRTEELERLNAELARSNHALDEFAYIASHDLKEPLRGISSYAHFLAEDYKAVLDEEGVSMLETLQRLSQRMAQLIEELLEYSRLGRIDLAIQETDLEEVLQRVLESLEVMFDIQEVKVVVPAPLPRVTCDFSRVGEVFRNLLINAVKYNDKREKRVEIGWRRDETVGGSQNAAAGTTFYVQDNGIGIPEKHFESVFRIFKRLHPRDAFGGGTGAGLTIVQKIVERHGGRIWVESKLGEGSTFFFTLSPDS